MWGAGTEGGGERLEGVVAEVSRELPSEPQAPQGHVLVGRGDDQVVVPQCRQRLPGLMAAITRWENEGGRIVPGASAEI